MSVNQHPCDRCECEIARNSPYYLCDGGTFYHAYFCEECLENYQHLVIDEDDSDDESVADHDDDFDEDPEPIRGAVIATATPCDCEDPQ